MDVQGGGPSGGRVENQSSTTINQFHRRTSPSVKLTEEDGGLVNDNYRNVSVML